MTTTRSRNKRRVALKRLPALYVMESNPLSVRDSASVRSAANTLRRHCLDSAPVTDESGQLVGIVTVKDIARLMPEQRTYTRVSSVMGGRDRVHTTSPDATVLEAFEVMDEHDLEQLPVMDGDQPIGLLTRADVARLLRVKG